MDVQSIIAARGYAAQRPATEPVSPGSEPVGRLGKAVDDFAETLHQSEELAQKSMVQEADPHTLVEALSQSELAVQTVVAVRNKVVEAYQEILRMPV